MVEVGATHAYFYYYYFFQRVETKEQLIPDELFYYLFE